MASAEALALLASPAAAKLPPFTRAVLRACAAIPRGRVATYGALAAAAGAPRAAQAVGNALHANPFAPTVPCHRVLPVRLTLGGFEGAREGGDTAAAAKKRALLAAEGVVFDAAGRLADPAHVWTPAAPAAPAAPTAAAAAAAPAAAPAARGKRRRA